MGNASVAEKACLGSGQHLKEKDRKEERLASERWADLSEPWQPRDCTLYLFVCFYRQGIVAYAFNPST